MKTSPALVCLFLSFAAFHGECAETQTAGPASSGTTAATLKAQLVESLKADQKSIGSAEADSRKSGTLSKVISILQNQHLTGTYESTRNEQLDYYLQSGGASEKSSALCASYLKQLEIEATEAKKKFTDDALRTGRAAMKKAMEAKSVDEIQPIADEIQNLANRLDSRSGGYQYQKQFSKLNSSLDHLVNLQRYAVNGSLGDVSSQLSQLEKSLREVPDLVPADEAKAFTDQLRQKFGLPAPADMPRILKDLTDQLLDDSNQDQLDPLVEKIKTHQSLFSSSYSGYSTTSNASSWRALYSLATSFSQGVRQVKNGGYSQFSPERWTRDNSENHSLISTRDLLKRVKTYKVKVDDGISNTTTELMYYDLREVLERMQTLEDVRRELPVFKKAQRYQSGMSDGGDWSQATPALEYLVSIVTKLESGESFLLTMEYTGYGEMRRYSSFPSDHPGAPKFNALNEQLQRAILRRFYPEITADEKSPPAKIFTRQLEKAKAARTYSDLVTLNQLALYCNPGQPLIGHSEMAGVSYYLSGLRQEEELQEPRLATYYFQKAAAIRTGIIPIEEIRTRLHRLKKDYPADYDKGTEDSFRAISDDFGHRLIQQQLMVPAKK